MATQEEVGIQTAWDRSTGGKPGGRADTTTEAWYVTPYQMSSSKTSERKKIKDPCMGLINLRS